MLFRQSAAERVAPEESATPSDKSTDRLELVSLTVVSSPNHNNVTMKVDVGGSVRTLESHEGVGPIDAIWGALKDLGTGFDLKRCRTREAGPGSNVEARASAVIVWKGMEFLGMASDPNTLDASAKAIIDALNKLRIVQKFTRGRTPVLDGQHWIGTRIKPSSSSRGHTGVREFVLFKTTVESGQVVMRVKRRCTRKQRSTVSKRIHSVREIHSVKSTNAAGDGCEVFTIRHSERHFHLP